MKNIKMISVLGILLLGTWIHMFLFPIAVFAVEKRVEVDLTNQRLYAYEDGRKVYDFLISSGKIKTPTPTGAFWPWMKLRYTTMQGGSKQTGDQYRLLNVPYVIYFYNQNFPKNAWYALHGTYWHNNFGHPMSHGCVNLQTTDMAKLYYWIDTVSYNAKGEGSGTIITISGTTPTR